MREPNSPILLEASDGYGSGVRLKYGRHRVVCGERYRGRNISLGVRSGDLGLVLGRYRCGGAWSGTRRHVRFRVAELAHGSRAIRPLEARRVLHV